MSRKDAMRPANPDVKLTYDDFLLFPDDGQRHELIDGEHYVTPCPNTKHQRMSGNLYWLLRSYLEVHPIGELFYAPFDVVEPDLLYMSNARAAVVLTSKNVKGTPELVVEIGSPSTRKRDETIKRRLYERSGVVEYWIVDPELDVIRIHRGGSRGFERLVELSLEAGDVLTTPLLPDVQLPLAQIFRDRQ